MPAARAQNDNPGFAIFEVVVLYVLLAIAVANIRRSGLGRRFLSVRANERAAAASASTSPAQAARLRHQRGDRRHRRRDARLQAGRGVVRQLPYLASLALLAFAYLGGITSVNGAVVGGLLVAGGLLAAVTSNYFCASTIESYLGIIGGLGMILTAIIHPEGIAPFLQEEPALRRQLADLGDPRRAR